MGIQFNSNNRLPLTANAKKAEKVDKELANVDGTKPEGNKTSGVKVGDVNVPNLADANAALANYNLAGIKWADNGKGVDNGTPVVRTMDDKPDGGETTGGGGTTNRGENYTYVIDKDGKMTVFVNGKQKGPAIDTKNMTTEQIVDAAKKRANR